MFVYMVVMQCICTLWGHICVLVLLGLLHDCATFESWRPFRLFAASIVRRMTLYFRLFMTLAHISTSPVLASLSGNPAMAARARSA